MTVINLESMERNLQFKMENTNHYFHILATNHLETNIVRNTVNGFNIDKKTESMKFLKYLL